VTMLETHKAVRQRDLSHLKTQRCPKLSSQHHLLWNKSWIFFLILRKLIQKTVTESHEDSHSNNSKLSVKASFWGSPDISSGIEKLFEVMGLYDKSKTLIISMNLCSIKNMIQLSNLDLHDCGNMFSRQDLRDSVFQDSIIKDICLGKCFKMLIKEVNELDDDADVAEQLIPSTFEEETNFLSTENIETFRIHYTDSKRFLKLLRRFHNTRFFNWIYN
jgi:hypothetical protein